jgi:hypothetical protein
MNDEDLNEAIKVTKKGLEIASTITGIEYSREEVERLAVRIVRSDSCWAQAYLDGIKVLEIFAEDVESNPEIGEGTLEFRTLKDCGLNVRNEDLLELMAAYSLYIVAKYKITDEIESGNVLPESKGLLLYAVYSGYDFFEWADLLKEVGLIYRTYSMDCVRELLDAMYAWTAVSKDEYGNIYYLPEKFHKVSEIVRDLKELVRIALAVRPGYIKEGYPIFQLENARDRYIQYAADYTCFEENTVRLLIDSYIPVSLFDYNQWISQMRASTGYVPDVFARSRNLREMYERLFGEDSEAYSQVLFAHREAFHTLARLITNDKIVATMTAFIEKYALQFSNKTHLDISWQLGTLINNLLSYIISDVYHSGSTAEAEARLFLHFDSMKVFCEGVLDLLSDPSTRDKATYLLNKMRFFSDIGSGINRAYMIVRDIDAMLSFPRDLVIAAVKSMPAKEAYAYVLSKGGVPL